MNKFIYSLVLAWGVCIVALAPAYSQTGVGSSTADNSIVTIEAGTAELRFAETSYFGPNSQWEINGTLEIWSKYIWISPSARFTGSGKIIIHDPGTNPYYSGMTTAPTQIDGNNGLSIATAIEMRNPSNLRLTDLTDPGYGSTNPTGNKAAALNIGSSFDFAVDGGDVILNGFDFGIEQGGSLIGYNSKRMIVTGNSISGHVLKNYASISPFVFPMGIAEGDYTPATLTPASPAILHVSVQNYAAANLNNLSVASGIDRAWHIYANQGIGVNYTLQHNTITNGSSYVDASAQIMQYATTGYWIGGTTIVQGAAIHTRTGIVTTTDPLNNTSWFTKHNSMDGPIAVNDNKENVETGTSAQINVLENDKPGSSPIVVASVRIVQRPQYGSVMINSDGSITYTANIGFVGIDTFEYEITDQNGLKATAKVTVKVVDKAIHIPNVITPDGDGKNDFLIIVGKDNYDRVEVEFYNRWGNQVYFNKDYKNDWNGEKLNEGTYYYSVRFIKGSTTTIRKGWVLIKR
jgi:gliding motility-associated-like protein